MNDFNSVMYENLNWFLLDNFKIGGPLQIKFEISVKSPSQNYSSCC